MEVRKMPKQHSIKFNFIMNAILKMSAFVFPLITFPYVSRVLGAVGNGKIAFATSVISYFSMFAQLGIPTYGIRICAAYRNDKIKLNRTIQELLIINTIMVVFSYLVFFISLQFVTRFQQDRMLLIIASTTILLNAIGMDWLFQALEQYSYITIRNLGFKILSIILMFLFVHKPEHYIVYGVINVIGTCGSNIFNLIYANRFLEHKILGEYNIKQHLKPILNFFMLSVSISVYTAMDSVMLGFLSSDAEVGYYAAATKMKSILVSAVTALGGVLLPRMSNYVSEGKIRDFYKLIRKSFNFILIISIPITIYFIIMSDATISFLAGNGYDLAIMPMKIISLTVVFISLSNITGMQILVPTNRELLTTKSTIVGAVVNLLVNAITIPKFGAIGAAIGTVVAEFFVLATQVVYIRRELPEMILGIQLGKIVLANFSSMVILILLKNNLTMKNNLVELVITSIVFFGIYMIVLIVLKEQLILSYLNMYINKIKLINKAKK